MSPPAAELQNEQGVPGPKPRPPRSQHSDSPGQLSGGSKSPVFFTAGGDLFTSRGGTVMGQGRVAHTRAAFVAPAQQILEDITCLD